MAKEVTATLKLRIPAGKASAGPPVGSTLGQYGLNMMDFINPFNEQTKDLMGSDVIVHLRIFEDRTFEFILKTPPAAVLLLKAAGKEKGSGTPNKEKVGSVTKDQVREIAEKKMDDLNATDVEEAMKIIEGTARSMGIEVK